VEGSRLEGPQASHLEEEVLAIAEHEQIPEMAATTLTEYLTHQERGTEKFVR
jgi:hypothetical protein